MMMLALGLIAVVLAPVVWRWRGMNEDTVPSIVRPRFIRRALCAFLVGLAAFAATGDPLAWLAAPLSFYGIVVGHGSYFPGGGAARDNEVFAFITRRLSDPMNEPTKAVGMALTGLAVTVPVALIPAVSLWVAPVGILKAIAYLFPWAIGVKNATDVAEYITGGFLVAGVLLLG